jgi:signal transduction histidine kinase
MEWSPGGASASSVVRGDLAVTYPPATAVDAAAALELLDAALTPVELPHVLAAVAGWWRTRAAASAACAAVVDDHLHAIHAACTRAQGSPCTVLMEQCRLNEASIQARLEREFQFAGPTQWLPLECDGRALGMLALAGAPATEVPPLWLDVTRRLLLHARDRADRLLHARLESLAEFCAGAGHEINNPLGTIVGRTQLLARAERDPQRLRTLGAIGGQALRARDMIGDVMLFARPPEPSPVAVRLAGAVAAVAARLAEDLAAGGVELHGSRDSAVEIAADPAQLEIVVSELMRNSLQAMSGGGILTIDVASREVDGRAMAELIVSDEGPGLSPLEREHLFDPFYSGRQAGRGFGFGLSKCWRIVTQHQGCIHAVPREGGLTMIVHWPMWAAKE